MLKAIENHDHIQPLLVPVPDVVDPSIEELVDALKGISNTLDKLRQQQRVIRQQLATRMMDAGTLEAYSPQGFGYRLVKFTPAETLLCEIPSHDADTGCHNL